MAATFLPNGSWRVGRRYLGGTMGLDDRMPVDEAVRVLESACDPDGAMTAYKAMMALRDHIKALEARIAALEEQ